MITNWSRPIKVRKLKTSKLWTTDSLFLRLTVLQWKFLFFSKTFLKVSVLKPTPAFTCWNAPPLSPGPVPFELYSKSRCICRLATVCRAHCSVFTALYTVRSVYCSVHTALTTVCNAHCIMHTVLYTLKFLADSKEWVLYRTQLMSYRV